MARGWHKSLVIFGLAFVFTFAAACNGEGPDDNQGDCDPEVDENCPEECVFGVDENCPPPCDPDEFDTIEGYDECLCEAGDQDFCPEEITGCQSDNDCGGGTPYCYIQDNTCVSTNFICTLLNCSGEPGVCDADNRTCVNAEFCTSTNDCLGDYLCVENSCELEAEVCDCPIDFECIYDRNNLTATCERIDQVCEPGSRICSADGQSLLACNSEGTAINPIACLNGCDQGEDTSASSTTGICNRPLGDQCTTPIAVAPGDTYELAWRDYENNITPGVLTNCVNSDTRPRTLGPEAFFEVTVPAGEVLSATMNTAADYGFFYILTQCTEGAQVCVVPGGQTLSGSGNSFTRTVWHTNTTSEEQTILLIADTTVNASGSASFAFESAPSVCTPGSRVCSESQLEECNPQGTAFTDLYSCALGCNAEGNGCEVYAHASCGDALDLREESGQSFTGRMADFMGAAGTFNAGDQCDSSEGTPSTYAGNTAYFAMDLIEGERVVVNLASTFDAALWVADGCLSSEGSCLAAVNQGSQTEQLVFQAEEEGTYYVAVQAVGNNRDETGTFTIDITIDLPICLDEDAGTILGCFEGNLIGFCTGSSDFPSFYGCTGGCEDGECTTPSGDRCLDPIVAESGTVYSGSFATQNHMLQTPNTACLGTGIVARANDTIYEVTLEPGQILNAELISPASNAGLYLLNECPVTGATSSFCEASSFPTKTLDLYKEDGGTFYLVVASTNGAESSSFQLDIEIKDGICLPGSTTCTDGVTRLCNETGDELTPVETCLGGCGTNQCAGLDGLNDNCTDANEFARVTGPSVVRDSFDEYFASSNISSGSCGLPSGTALQGPEAYYEVQLGSRQGFTAKLNTSTNAALVLYSSCSGAGACLQTQLTSAGDTLAYYAPNGGTYYLAAKAVASSTAAFTIDFDFFDGDCDPATDNACMVDGNGNSIASQCTSLGEQIIVECPFGCEDGACNNRPGDFCHTAFDIDADADFDEDLGVLTYSYSSTLSGFTNNYDPRNPSTGASCTGWFGNGPEVVFSFLGWNGDTIDIDLTTNYDGTLWITTDCSNGGGTACVDGVADTFGVGTESLSYEITETRMYYIMADAVQAGATGSIDLDVTINVGPRLVEPTIDIIDAPVALTGTTTDDSTTSFGIGNLGDIDLNFEIEADEDWLVFEPADGTIPGESVLNVDVTASCPAAPGTYVASYTITSNDVANSSVTYEFVLTCNELPGSMVIELLGVPSGQNPLITVTGNDYSETFLVDNLIEINNLIPGEYTIIPNPFGAGGSIYTAPAQTVTIVTQEETEVVIVYTTN